VTEPTWQAGDIQLYLGDCLEILPQLEAGSVDAVVTDPPYGITNSSGWNGLHGDCSITGDESTTVRDKVLQMYIGLPAIVFGSWRIKRPEGTRAVLIWDKGGHSGMGDLSFPWKPNFEEIYIIGNGFSGRRTTSVLAHYIHPSFNASRTHPNEKPIYLMNELVGKCPAGTILDPFMGSGTTGVACVQTGRKFIGIEIEEKYFDIAVKRIQQAQLQIRMDI